MIEIFAGKEKHGNMKIIEVLHSFWTGNRTESPRNRKSWVKIEKAIKEVVPQDKQEDFTRMLLCGSDRA